jgi:chromate transporter
MHHLLAGRLFLYPSGLRLRGRRAEMSERTIDMRRSKRIALPALFFAFFRLGVMSFGGGTAGWLYREIVERRRWIDDKNFLSGAALGRLMPGSGGVNLTVQVGQILRGAPGAIAAVLGLLSGPLGIVLALAAGYTRVSQNVILHAVLDGVAAAAIGLTFATGLKLVRFRIASAGPLAVTGATVLCIGVLRWPMIPVVLCLAPISIALALVDRRGRNA